MNGETLQPSLIDRALGRIRKTVAPVSSFLTKQLQDFSTVSILKANVSPRQKVDLIQGKNTLKEFPGALQETIETGKWLPKSIRPAVRKVGEFLTPQQYKPTNILKETLQRLPEEIKETTAKGLLLLPDTLRKVLKISPRPDYKPIKEAFVERYGLTEVASDLWDDAKFKLKQLDESMPYGLHYQPINIASDVISEYVPEGAIQKFIPEKIWRTFEDLPPKGKALIEVYKQVPEVVLHELGHLFLSQGIMDTDKSGKITASFSSQWDKLNEKGNAFTVYIDNKIHGSYGDKIDPNSLLQERYAIMFELAGMYGVDGVVPQTLQKYINPFMESTKEGKEVSGSTAQTTQQPSLINKALGRVKEFFKGQTEQIEAFPTAAILRADISAEQKAELIKKQQEPLSTGEFLGTQMDLLLPEAKLAGAIKALPFFTAAGLKEVKKFKPAELFIKGGGKKLLDRDIILKFSKKRLWGTLGHGLMETKKQGSKVIHSKILIWDKLPPKSQYEVLMHEVGHSIHENLPSDIRGQILSLIKKGYSPTRGETVLEAFASSFADFITKPEELSSNVKKIFNYVVDLPDIKGILGEPLVEFLLKR